MSNQIITINSRKFDNSIHRSWQCEILKETTDYWLFVGEFDQEIRHPKLGSIKCGTVSYEYYWKTKWFNVFRFHEPTGEFRNYYCNINFPPILQNNILDYIDLDLDILVNKDFSVEILDQDEFEVNSAKFGYSDDIKKRASDSLAEILEMIKVGTFPFNLYD